MTNERPSFSMRAMLRALCEASGDRTLRALADRAGTTPAGARRTLVALGDRGWATEHVNETYSVTQAGIRALDAEDARLAAQEGRA